MLAGENYNYVKIFIFMDFNLTKYEGLSQHHRTSFKWVDSSTSRSVNPHFSTKSGCSLRLEFPKKENHNISINLTRSRESIDSLQRSLQKPQNLSSISVVQYKRESKALEASTNSFFRRTSPERSIYTNRFGSLLLKNTCQRGLGSQQARNAKELSEIKNKIVNLPGTSVTPSRFIKIIGRLAHGLGNQSLSHSNEARKNVNFRLKLKKPEFMKAMMNKKIQLSRSILKTENLSADTPKKEELFQDIEFIPSRMTHKPQTTGVKSKLSKLQTSADKYELFNIEPWNIDL